MHDVFSRLYEHAKSLKLKKELQKTVNDYILDLQTKELANPQINKSNQS